MAHGTAIAGRLALALLVLGAGCAKAPPPRPPAPLPPVAPPPAPPPSAPPPSIRLAPMAGSAGTAVTVTGRGFPAAARVTVHVGPPQSEAHESPLGSAVADARGAVTVTFPMPALGVDGAGSAPKTVVVLAAGPAFREKATAEFAYAPVNPSPSSSSPVASPTPSPSHPLARKLSARDARAIQQVVSRHLEGIRLMAGVTIDVQSAIGSYARAVAIPPPGRGDPAYVFVKRGPRGWRVRAGPATSFGDEELKRLGIPSGLWPKS